MARARGRQRARRGARVRRFCRRPRGGPGGVAHAHAAGGARTERHPRATNRLKLAPLADHVLSGFRRLRRALGGAPCRQPVRADIAALPMPESRFAGHSGRPGLLVVSGSQGAAKSTKWVPARSARLEPEAPRSLAPMRAPVACARRGRLWLVARRGARERLIDDMAQAYAWADLGVVLRRRYDRRRSSGPPACWRFLVSHPARRGRSPDRQRQILSERGAAILVAQSEFHPG